MTIVVVILVAVTAFVIQERLRTSYEVASLRLFPNASRAMSYGDRHFDSASEAAYDIDIAERFFKAAETLDPNVPYLHHQLARIAFLRGRYWDAMGAVEKQIAQTGDSFPNAFYLRGLIEGFRGDYEQSIADYRKYLEFDPTNWAATNDLAWVLLRADRPQEALDAIEKVMGHWPANAWLLNSKATALRELGRIPEARVAIDSASLAVKDVTPNSWLVAYPGNDPLIAERGADALRQAIEINKRSIEALSPVK